MKKLILSLIAILLFTAIVWSAYYIISRGSNPSGQNSSEDTYQQPTTAPTPAVTEAPTAPPEPTPIVKKPTILFPVSQMMSGNLRYGYINENGVFALEPIFESASDFHDGLAVVTLNGKYRVIDEAGNILFTNSDLINDFSNGMALFATIGKNDMMEYGYINRKGEIIIEPQYVMATDFQEDGTAYAYLGEGHYVQINLDGSVIESYALSPEYGTPWNFHGKYMITTSDSNTGMIKYGVINLKSDIILEPIYNDVIYLGKDLFAVKNPSLTDYSEIMAAPYAIFNALGQQLTDYSLYDVSSFHGDYATASDDTSTFFIGPDGKKVSALPSFEGFGTLELYNNIVKGYIDGRLFYSTLDKAILWQENTTYPLTDSILVKEIKYRPNRNVLVYYPRIEGLADETAQLEINAKLQQIFADSRADVKLEDLLTANDGFEASLVNNLLIISRSGYDYYFGAAHGMPVREYYYFDIRTGALFEFKDLFKENSNYAEKINQMINAEIAIRLQAEDSMLFEGAFNGISENPNFILKEKELVIYFTPYEISAYAAGYPEFSIPYVDIMEFISKDGAFWNAFSY